MYCTVCGRPVDPSAQFCSACGAKVAPSSGDAPLAPTLPAPSSDLTRLSHLVMTWDRLSSVTHFEFQDPYDRPLGSTQGETVFPFRFTLFDETGRAVLSVDAQRVRGLLYDYLIHDAEGAVLASLRMESSFLGRKYGLTVAGRNAWLLTTDAQGYHYQIEELSGGRVLATGDRKPGMRTAIAEIAIVNGQPLDHRVVIGAMLLAGFFTTRG